MNKQTILIVDDEDDIRLSLRDFLIKNDFNVLVASDGVGAIKILIDYPIDLIITDYRMDVFGGDYWVKFLKKFCPDLKVIVTSAYLNEDYSISYYVFHKPFDFNDLLKMTNKLLDKS